MSHTPVLIVGAGPSGLMMACELARFNIPFRIIDQKSERTLTSNAAGIQTRTLELLNYAGLLPTFVRRGVICKAININVGSVTIEVSFDQLQSLYHYILLLPQADTEEILIHHLTEQHHYIERPVSLVEFTEQNNQYQVTVKNQSGQLEKISCDYMIACDGAHSLVREKCGIQFIGDDINEQFVVADAKMDAFLDNDRVHVFVDQGKALAVFPIGVKSYRLAANLHLDHPRQFFTEKEIKEIVIERGRGEFNVETASWISPFWIHSKIVDQFRIGNIFFVGDAAHIHSPVGGQGMNTGIQDAYNLAWKLALVIRERAHPSLLDSYQLERHPIVLDIVQKTELMTKLMVSRNKFQNAIRNIILRIARHSRFILNKVCMRITQLAIRYRKSPIISYQNSISGASLPGALAPDVQITSTDRLYDHCKNTHHNILLFAGTDSNPDTIASLLELQKKITQHYPDIASAYLITNDAAQIANHVIYDVDNQIHKRYHVRSSALFIIRPDQYIGASNKSGFWDTIQTYFQQLGIRS